MKAIFLSVSMLFAGLFFLCLAFDLIQNVIHKFQNKPYEFAAPKMFYEADSWISALVMAAMIFAGVYSIYMLTSDTIQSEYEAELVKCDYCNEMFPETYDTRDSWYTICPHCTNKEINEMVRLNSSICSVCGNQYDLQDGKNGMCWDCYLDESAECTWCGNPAPYELSDGEGFFLCTECMGELMRDENVIKAIRKTLDS